MRRPPAPLQHLIPTPVQLQNLKWPMARVCPASLARLAGGGQRRPQSARTMGRLPAAGWRIHRGPLPAGQFHITAIDATGHDGPGNLGHSRVNLARWKPFAIRCLLPVVARRAVGAHLDRKSCSNKSPSEAAAAFVPVQCHFGAREVQRHRAHGRVVQVAQGHGLAWLS